MVVGVSALIKIRHENILPILGVTTKFHSRVSLVSKWMENGNAREYVQNGDVDPNPLVCRQNTSSFPIEVIYPI